MDRELKRNEQEGMLGGVCAGLGEHIGIDKTWIRLIFILSIFFSAAGIGLIGPIAYVIMWVVVPRKPLAFSDFQEHYNKASRGKGYDAGEEENFRARRFRANGERKSVGLVLLSTGCLLLVLQLDLLTWDELIKFWPILFIVAGLFTVFTSFTLKGKDLH